MASATVSTRSDAPSRARDGDGDPEPPAATRRWRYSLAPRILAVNVFAILALAISVIYLDSFRERLIDQRRIELRRQAALIGDFMAAAPIADWPRLAARYGRTTATHLRVYEAGAKAAKLADSWAGAKPTFELVDPRTEPFKREAARTLDIVIEGFGKGEVLPDYLEPAHDTAAAWPEVRTALAGGVADALRRAPDRTVIVTAAAPLGRRAALQLAIDTRDITKLVRRERSTLGLVFLGVLAVSLLFSNFLADTIVRPLRLLAVSAQRVRLGRAREVTVPRFRERRDEIGQLARAVSDMTQALRARIDATEAFAADVAHELKNPLASLRSAVDSLELVRDAGLRAQLMEVIRDDVGRIDRLITDIADASRLDAELSRSRFERLDLGDLTGTLVRAYDTAGCARGVEIAYARPEGDTAVVAGEGDRLAQVVRNLIDNAVSFSPPAGLVVVTVVRADDRVVLRVDDRGPGIRPENREDIFRRFYTERPEAEDFGRHSGLGLAIVRTIVEAHDGTVAVAEGEGGTGTRVVVSLPAV